MSRITTNPEQMGGVPCIRGLRIPVSTIVSLHDAGMTTAEILRDYPGLVAEDVFAALEHVGRAEPVDIRPYHERRREMAHCPECGNPDCYSINCDERGRAERDEGL